MAFQVSPGVNTSEIDLTNVVVSAGTSTGGFAGRFRWGPIEEVTLITDEDNLVSQFQNQMIIILNISLLLQTSWGILAH